MAFPFMNSSRKPNHALRAGLRRALPNAPERPSRKMLFEPLEPRVLLDGEGALLAMKDSFQHGFDALYNELEALGEDQSIFGSLVPGFLTTQFDASTNNAIIVSPTLGEALTISVDVDAANEMRSIFWDSTESTLLGYSAFLDKNFSHSLQGRFGYILEEIDERRFLSVFDDDYLDNWQAAELALDAMDINRDGKVSGAEAFGVLVLGQISYWASTIELGNDPTPDDLLDELRYYVDTLYLPSGGVLGYLQDYLDIYLDYASINTAVQFVNGSLVLDFGVTLTLFQAEIPDLGYMADENGILLDPGPPDPVQKDAYKAKTIDVLRTLSFETLQLGVADVLRIWMGDLTPANNSDQFFFAAPGGVGIDLTIDDPNNLQGFKVHVGFLGTTALAGSQIHLDMGLTGSSIDPSNPAPLGFGGGAVETHYDAGGFSWTTIDAADLPATGTLANDVEFRLTIGKSEYSATRTVVIPAGTDLDAGLVAAVELALVDAGLDGIVTGVSFVDGKLRLHLELTNPHAAGFGASGFHNDNGILIGSAAADFAAIKDFGLTFMLALNGGVPKLIRLDPGSEFVNHLELVAALQPLVDAAFGAGVIEVFRYAPGGGVFRLGFDSAGAAEGQPLEITTHMSFDGSDRITIAEMTANRVFDGEANPNATFEAVLNLKTDSGLLDHEGNSWRPEGTIHSSPDGVNAGPFNPFTTVQPVVIESVPAVGEQRDIAKATYPLVFGGEMAEMLNFNVLGVSEMLGIVNQLAVWLDRLVATELFTAFDIPFTQAALADLLKFGDMIRDSLLIDDRDDGLKAPGAGGNDIARLLGWATIKGNAQVLPYFNNVQNFGTLLGSVLYDVSNQLAQPFYGSLAEAYLDMAPSYNPVSNELTFRLKVGHNLVPHPLQASGGIEVPLAFDIELEPLTSIITESNVKLTSTGTFEFTLGIVLDGIQPLQNDSPLTALNDGRGVQVNTNLAVTTLDGIDPIVGRLSSDARFWVLAWTASEGVVYKPVDLLWSKSSFFLSWPPRENADAPSTRDNVTFDDLVDDLNAALAQAGLGDLFEAVFAADNQFVGSGDRETGRVVLVAKSPDVLNFQVFAEGGNSASKELGLSQQLASTVSFVAPVHLSVFSANSPVEFTLNIVRNGATEIVPVSISADRLVGNNFVSDLLNDLNTALRDAFPVAIEANRLADISASRTSGTPFLVLSAVSSDIESFTITNANATAITLLGLDHFAAIQQLGALGVNMAAVDNPMTAGIVLRAPDVASNPFGRLTHDIKFKINDTEISVSANDARDNASLSQLVKTLNAAINGSALAGKVYAALDGVNLQFLSLDTTISSLTFADVQGNAAGQLGFADGKTATTELKIVANRAAPVSFGITGEDGALPWLPTTQFKIDIQTASGAHPTITVSLSDTATIQNRSLFDLAADLNAAIGAGFVSATGLTGDLNPLIAVVQGERIVIGLKTERGGSALAGELNGPASTVTGFSVYAEADSKAATELKLPTVGNSMAQASNVDFLIEFSDGHAAYITVDSLVDLNPAESKFKFRLNTGDLQALFSLMVQQAGTFEYFDGVEYKSKDRLSVTLRPDGAGLQLVDNTFAYNPGGSEFRVVAVNGSPAALQLGILASDTNRVSLGNFEPAAFGNPDGIIQGARVATLDIVDRVFIEDAKLRASVGVAASGNLLAYANFGFIGVELTAPDGQNLYRGDVALLDGLGRLELRDLFDSVGTGLKAAAQVGLPVFWVDTNHDTFTMEVNIFPAFPASIGNLVTVGGSPEISFQLTSLGIMQNALIPVWEGETLTAIKPAVILTPKSSEAIVDVSGIGGNLAKFNLVGFEDVLKALRQVGDFLMEFDKLGFQDDTLPLLGISIGDLLDLGQRFNSALLMIELNPAGGLQLLDQALRQAFGIPEFGDLGNADNLAALKAYLTNRGIPLPANDADLGQLIGFSLTGDNKLRFDLRLPFGFSQAQSIDLDLGSVNFLGGALPVSLQGGANLNLKGYLDAMLSFGIDLADPKALYLYTGATGITGALSASADNLAFNAGIGPMGVSIRDGNASVDIKFGLNDPTANAGDSLRIDLLSVLDLFGAAAGYQANLLGNINANLPVFFPDEGTFLGDIGIGVNGIGLVGDQLNIPDFDIVLPDFSFIDLSLIDPFSSLPLMLDALDFFLGALQDILDGEVFGLQLPLIGDQLQAGGDFIEKLRRDVLTPIRQFTEQAPELGVTIIEQLLFALLGDGSAGVKINGVDLIEFLGLENEFDGLGLLKGNVTSLAEDGAGFIGSNYLWSFNLGREYRPSVNVGFDLGFPALGLALDGDIDVKIDWTLALGIGISSAHGAYIKLGDHQGGTDKEFTLDLEVRLPNAAEGRLGFLQVIVDNQVLPDPNFTAKFGVDLFNGAAGADKNLLTFSNLGSIDALITLDADAMLDLGLVVQFNRAIIPDTIAAVIPSLRADFILDWSFNSGPGGLFSGDWDLAAGLNTVGFYDVQLDLGSFLGEFLGPFVSKIAEIVGPFQPVIDAFTTPIPLISDLAGRPITLLDIAGIFGEVDTGMIYAIADIVSLVNQIGQLGSNTELLVPIGDFVLFDGSNPAMAFNLASPTFKLGGDKKTSDFDFDDFISSLPDIDLAAGISGDSAAAGLSKSLINKTAPGSGSFIFPLFDNPALAFGLLIGRDISLVEYDLAPFGVDFSYVQKFPIWGPLFARITGSVGLTIDLAFGYDTAGVRKFAEGNFSNPLDLLAGFYINDTDQPGGVGSDVPELILRGELFAGAEVNLGIASAGVEGGIILTINFDLYDNDGDGKVRIDELVGNFLYEFKYGNVLSAPIAIFDVFGDISLQLRAFIEFLFFEETFEITPPIVLAPFNFSFDRPPILATERGDGALLLNIGPNAAARLNGDTRDIGETIFVRSLSASEVEVWSPVLGVGSEAAQRYSIGANKLVIAYGGEGNDVINLVDLGHGIRYFVDAGAGDDIVFGGKNGGEMRGGLGDDQLYGGEGDDLIIGGLGNDLIKGNGGNNWLFGDEGSVTEYFDTEKNAVMLRFRAIATADDGDDTIYGGPGDGFNIIFGGGGYDLIFGGDGDDLIIGDGGYFEGLKAEGGVPWVSPTVLASNGLDPNLKIVDISQISTRGLGAADRIYGGPGNDTILGGAGDDFIDGGVGNDLISGGTGNDTIYGGGGSDWLFGDEGDDIIFGFRDPYDTADFALYPWVAYVVDQAAINGDGGDYIEGGDGNDFIRGQGGNDRIHGNRGNDIIFGDTGDDTIGAGFLARPWVHASKQSYDNESGADIIFGGADDDTINAGAGADIVFGDDGLVVYLYFAQGGSLEGLRPANERGSTLRTDGIHKLVGDGNEAQLIKTSDAPANDAERWDDRKWSTPDLYATEPLASDGVDTIAGGDSGDIIFGGGKGDYIYGDFNPADELFGPRPTGADVIIGDGGRVEMFNRRFLAIEAISNTLDGDDFIYGNDGNDFLFGGGGSDKIWGFHLPGVGGAHATPLESVTDNDVIFGDNGRIEFDASDRFNRIKWMWTTYVAGDSGGSDEVFGQFGDDVIFGGLNTDGIDEILGGGLGNDIVIGDQGEILFYAPGLEDLSPAYPVFNAMLLGEFWAASFPLFLVRSFPDNIGGTDFIYGNQGADILIGGTAGDFMYGDDATGSSGAADGDDIMLGDNGEVWFNLDFGAPVEIEPGVLGPNISIGRLSAKIAAMPFASAVDLIRTSDTDESTGGADVMSGNAGADVMFGGVNNGGVDRLYGDRESPSVASLAQDRADILVGDNGEVDFSLDGNRLVLNLIRSYEDARGGTDIISGDAGGDIAIGGTGGDVIFGDRATPSGASAAADGNDMLIGDNAYILLTSRPDPIQSPARDLLVVLDAAVFLVRSTDEDYNPAVPLFNTGGVDTIAGNKGSDIIIGGVDGDFLYGDGVAVVFADPDNDDWTVVSRTAVRGGFDGNDIMLGDNGALEWLSTGRLAEVLGINLSVENPALWNASDWNGGVETRPGVSDYTSAAFWALLENVDRSLLHTLDLITTEQPNNGGQDWMWGGDGNDVMFGGTDSDTMFGDNGFAALGGVGAPENSGPADGGDTMFGDHGRLYAQYSVLWNGQGDWRDAMPSRNFFAIDTGAADGGEGDRMWGQGGDDIMLGQQGDDRMWGGDGDDDMIGGHNVSGGIDELGVLGKIQASLGGVVFNDLMDGGTGRDVMAGDNAIIWRRADGYDPRFRALTGTQLYTTTNDTILTHVEEVSALPGDGRVNPNGSPGRDVTLLDHDFGIEASDANAGRYGRDVMAGGAGDDVMFGQLGDDLMQGDGEIALAASGAPFLSWQVLATGLVQVPPAADAYGVLHFNIPERASDGNDYMEGNGGADLMFGGLGQDDMIGGSSSLFGLDGWYERPDGSDIMFGGAGIRVDRNDWGQAFAGFAGVMMDLAKAKYDANGNLVDIEYQSGGHSRDADYMMGDNANIYRIVGITHGGVTLIADPGLQAQTLVNSGTGVNKVELRASRGFLAYNYDNYAGEKIVVRAMEQIDYHLGGADYQGGSYTIDPVTGLTVAAHVIPGQPDNGAADWMHGEAGDDVMFGMVGSDIMFGGAGDDDMIGGYGHDWMSGGTGQDGMLGDDGLILSSRNSAGYGEPLNGIKPLLATDPRPKYSDGNVLNEVIYTPGNIQYSIINVEHQLKKSAILVPFSVDPDWVGMDDEYPDSIHYPFADDIMFGGWGSDWMHGGSGDDAMSGAEALLDAYVTVFGANRTPIGILNLGYGAVGIQDPTHPWQFLGIDTFGNQNPGDVLAFNPVDEDGWKTQNRQRAGEFYYYDEYDPLRKIMLTSMGELHKGLAAQGAAHDFLLNFNENEGIHRPGGWTPGNKNQSVWYNPVNDDGADVIFGDNGNDWLVGGTGRDHLYGGWGNDLLNADDNHNTNGGLNNQPDTHPFYEDIAYGGAGRDVLIGNTGGDRLIDWVGEYNSYLVPFAPFGMATVSRTLQPFLPEYLYALALGDGIDNTRAEKTGGDPLRNGEPFGELGLVLQKDFAWQAQTGAPADPQAGNIPGGKRDVLRTADFSGLNTSEAQGFMIDSGKWTVSKGRFQVEPTKLGESALAVWHHDAYQPNYFEVTATINVIKPVAGFKANGYLVFDYQDADNFKFAGLNQSTNKVEIGQKLGGTWTVLTSINLQIRHGVDYNLLLSVNGNSVILQVNNQQSVAYTFAPRVDADGIIYNINSGMVGLGADNSKTAIANYRLLVLPPQVTHSAVDDFSTQPALIQGLMGNWTLQSGKLVGTPAQGAQLSMASGELAISPAYVLQLDTKVATSATGGIVFDQYATDDFKWAAWNKATNQVQIGHYTAKGGWVVDKSVSMNLAGEVNLSVTLKGTTVSVLVNNSPAVSHVFNSIVTDGAFGVLAKGGTATFDHFSLLTDDPRFQAPASSNMTAAFAGSGVNVTPLEAASLDAIAQAAMNRWAFILGETPALFYGLEFTVADLGGLALARIEGNTITVDADAAGHGWFIDPTPYDDSEFRVRTADGLRANPSSEAFGKIDLLTVLMHELGHAIGYAHDTSVPGATSLMAEDLVPGLRAVDFVPPGQQSSDTGLVANPTVGDPGQAVNGKRGTPAAPAGAWSWDVERGAFVQDAQGWNNGRLFSYLSLGVVGAAAQGDDWLASEPAAVDASQDDWLEFAPATQESGEQSLIEWIGL